jgi:hypothetical protein
MTDPQNLHDIWLVLTVITTLETGGIALYLWKMFGRSSRKWFFWALALAFASVAVEQAVSEVKNLYGAPILNPELARMWVAGRAQQVVVLGGVLGYLVFGRNGNQPPVETEAPDL